MENKKYRVKKDIFIIKGTRVGVDASSTKTENLAWDISIPEGSILEEQYHIVHLYDDKNGSYTPNQYMCSLFKFVLDQAIKDGAEIIVNKPEIKILIEFFTEENPDQYPGWKVTYGEKHAYGLGYDEMIGLVNSITMERLFK